MVACKHKLKFDLTDSWVDREGRVAVTNIQLNGENIALISAYASNIFLVGFYDLLTKTLLDLAGFHLVVGADFNMVWGKNIDRTGEVENRDEVNV